MIRLSTGNDVGDFLVALLIFLPFLVIGVHQIVKHPYGTK